MVGVVNVDGLSSGRRGKFFVVVVVLNREDVLHSELPNGV